MENEDAGQTQCFGGMELINQSDCKAWHHQEQSLVGPSYEKIATRYTNDADTVRGLAKKIIKGGSGNWGEAAMSAHPGLIK